MAKDTVGKLSSELLLNDIHGDHTAGEQMQEQLSDYEKNLIECVNSGKNIYSSDFFVIVITKREKIMKNVLRHFFFYRESCPTPHHDQILYKYNHDDDRIEFLWSIPDKESCTDLITNAVNLDLGFASLLQFVLDFNDGTLDKKAAVLNGEII